MGRAWRDWMRRSHGSQPDFILAGWDFIEAYAKSIQHVNNTDAGTAKKLDGGSGQGESTGEIVDAVSLGVLQGYPDCLGPDLRYAR